MPASSAYIGRLAPAPTGALHLGNARTFLLAWLRCRSVGGQMLLRLEDLDHPRVKSGAARQAYADLAWLGLDWDQGPAASLQTLAAASPTAKSPLNSHAVQAADDLFIQSHRHAYYSTRLDQLDAQGRIYPCICTRKEIEDAQSAPQEKNERRYPGTCRGRFESEQAASEARPERPPCWRFYISSNETHFDDKFCGPQTSRLEDWSGDFVIAKTRAQASYQLAVVADDIAMGVTEVVRADDLLPSTHRQLQLYEALGHAPPAFFHVPLVIGTDGRRLAKRHGDTRIAQARERGTPPERIVGWLANTCGWHVPDEITPRELLRHFDPDAIPHTPVVVTDKDLVTLGLEPPQ